MLLLGLLLQLDYYSLVFLSSNEGKSIVEHLSLNNRLSRTKLFLDVVLLVGSSMRVYNPIETLLKDDQKLFILQKIKADNNIFVSRLNLDLLQ